jgi:hypothetical protein
MGGRSCSEVAGEGGPIDDEEVSDTDIDTILPGDEEKPLTWALEMELD